MTGYTSYITPKDPSNQESTKYRFSLPGYSKEDTSIKIANRYLLVHINKNDKEYLVYKEPLSKAYTPNTKVQAFMNDGLLKVYFHYENPVRKISIY